MSDSMWTQGLLQIWMPDPIILNINMKLRSLYFIYLLLFFFKNHGSELNCGINAASYLPKCCVVVRFPRHIVTVPVSCATIGSYISSYLQSVHWLNIQKIVHIIIGTVAKEITCFFFVFFWCQKYSAKNVFCIFVLKWTGK